MVKSFSADQKITGEILALVSRGFGSDAPDASVSFSKAGVSAKGATVAPGQNFNPES